MGGRPGVGGMGGRPSVGGGPGVGSMGDGLGIYCMGGESSVVDLDVDVVLGGIREVNMV